MCKGINLTLVFVLKNDDTFEMFFPCLFADTRIWFAHSIQDTVALLGRFNPFSSLASNCVSKRSLGSVHAGMGYNKTLVLTKQSTIRTTTPRPTSLVYTGIGY